MSPDTLYMLSAPGTVPCLPGPNQFPAILSHRITPTGQLLRLNAAPTPHGGIMVVCDCEEIPTGSPVQLCDALLRECLRIRPRGLLLDFERPHPFYVNLLAQLSPKLSLLGITLFLPESLAAHAPNCRVLIPSALSGGSLELRLCEAVERYGSDRVVLSLERCIEDFTLPALSGCGQPLSPEDLDRLRQEFHSKLHFSPALCTRYFTYQRAAQPHLVLCDDDDTMRQKTACARRCGIFRFLLLQCDKSSVFPDFSPQ